MIVNLPSSKDKLPKTYSVLQDLVNERNTWRIMGKVSYKDKNKSMVSQKHMEDNGKG